jgi:hypothetical protein
MTRYAVAFGTAFQVSWICPGIPLRAVREVGPAGIKVTVAAGGLGSRTITPGVPVAVRRGTVYGTHCEAAVFWFPLPTLTTWYS